MKRLVRTRTLDESGSRSTKDFIAVKTFGALTAMIVFAATVSGAMSPPPGPATILKCSLAKFDTRFDSGFGTGPHHSRDLPRIAGHAAGEDFWYKIDSRTWDVWDQHFGLWREYCEFHPQGLTRKCFATPLRYVARQNPFGEQTFTEELDRISGQVGFNVMADAGQTITATGGCEAVADPASQLPAPRF
ncbi:MAG TPA: hypothetical protein VFI23_14915 [Rhizomicrobium sp.]|nr:hypothetical protein [Rhizomicrobium sp.]